MKGLSAIGALVALKAAYSFLAFIWVAFLRPGKNLKKLGSWAVVTVNHACPSPQSHKQILSGFGALKHPPGGWPLWELRSGCTL